MKNASKCFPFSGFYSISLFILIFKDHKPCLPNNFIGEVEKESSQNELNKLSKMVQMNTEKATIK